MASTPRPLPAVARHPDIRPNVSGARATISSPSRAGSLASQSSSYSVPSASTRTLRVGSPAMVAVSGVRSMVTCGVRLEPPELFPFGVGRRGRGQSAHALAVFVDGAFPVPTPARIGDPEAAAPDVQHQDEPAGGPGRHLEPTGGQEHLLAILVDDQEPGVGGERTEQQSTQQSGEHAMHDVPRVARDGSTLADRVARGNLGLCPSRAAV